MKLKRTGNCSKWIVNDSQHAYNEEYIRIDFFFVGIKRVSEYEREVLFVDGNLLKYFRFLAQSAITISHTD